VSKKRRPQLSIFRPKFRPNRGGATPVDADEVLAAVAENFRVFITRIASGVPPTSCGGRRKPQLGMASELINDAAIL